MLLLLAGGLIAGFLIGVLVRHRVALRQAATLREVIDRQQKVITLQQSAVGNLVIANKHLDHWCERFRDLYIGAVAHIDPTLATELRAKWAQVQAPSAVARLLERARHG